MHLGEELAEPLKVTLVDFGVSFQVPSYSLAEISYVRFESRLLLSEHLDSRQSNQDRC